MRKRQKEKEVKKVKPEKREEVHTQKKSPPPPKKFLKRELMSFGSKKLVFILHNKEARARL
jgi:hypothetical protein